MTKEKKKESENGTKTASDSQTSVEDLYKKGLEAQASYDYPTAIDLYSQALTAEDISAEMEYEVLDQRAECYARMGEFRSQLDDLDRMVAISRELKAPELEMAIAFRRIFITARIAEFEKLRQIAESTMELAQGSDEDSIQAGASLAMSYYHATIDRYSEAQEESEIALRLYRAIGDRRGEANCLQLLSAIINISGNQALAEKYALEALDIWRALGDRKNEASALNAWGLTITDSAQEIDAKEEALEIFKEIGDQWGQGQMHNNLGLLYGQLGLYSTARDYAEHAVEMAREMGARLGLGLYLDSLARAEMNMGDYEKALSTYEECLALSQEIDSQVFQGFTLLGMGMVDLKSGKAGEARDKIQKTLEIFRENKHTSDIPTALAWLGAAYLALDEPKSARKYTAEGVTEQEAIELGGSEYPPQEVWWWHYLALTHGLRQDAAQEGRDVLQIPENAWSAIQKARQITFEGIASLSDEGLRRNYLNKVEINRQIITEWAHQAAARNLPIEVEEPPPGNVQAQLQRQLAIGVRMNERRDVDALIDFIMDELIELSGAERAMLLLMDEYGERSVAASYGFAEENKGGFLKQAENLLKNVEMNKMHVLRQDVHHKDINSTTDDPFEALSMLCVPLLSKGRLSGFIYADNHAIFGRFTQADVDLLAAFANQVAAAIENAQLYQGLEQRVLERTQELSASNTALEQRNAELGIINSVQSGLVSKLDFQEIIDLVGEKIQEIFKIQNMAISILDREVNQISMPYFIENGKRYPVEPFPFKENSGVIAHILSTKKPLLIHKNLEQVSKELGSTQSHGDEDSPMAESLLGVPILIGDESIGTISLFDHEKDTFDESDLRLLITLTTSMGLALENARLFDETNRLLDESQQRSAELAIINSVQEGLAEELDIPSIFELVGEKIREIFDSQVVMIQTFNHDQKLRENQYYVEKGERVSIDPLQFNQLSTQLIETRKPVVINQDVAGRMEELGMSVTPGTEPAKSLVFVPMVVGDTVVGAVSLQNVDRENAFPESAVRLLNTLTSSMSVALENARLFDETNHLLEESEQRSAELAIINSVQEGLAEELDIPSIFELVGEKIREIFDAQAVMISTFDHDRKIRHFPYQIEKGVRSEIGPLPFNQLTNQLIETRKPVVINKDLIDRMDELGMTTTPGTELPKSVIFVPMIAGDTVVGFVSLQNVDRENAFPESAVRLLNTLTSSMSVALENARLFDETNRLLEESEQRSAELAIINSVQEGLAEELDIPSIFELVGEKIREIFDAQVVMISTFDHERKIRHFPYSIEKGIRGTIDPLPFNQLTTQLIETRKPIVINQGTEIIFKELGMSIFPGTEPGKSLIFVPMIAGDTVVGFVSLQNVDRENAFPESAVRLLNTLTSSMSVALENARLFDETNRLLKETQQRAAELTTVNTVSQALSSELELEALIELIGDQVRQIFSADITYVAMLDQQSYLIEFPYAVGEDLEAMPYGEGLTSKIIESGEALLINEDVNETVEEIGATHTGVDVQSYLGVPIMAGGQAIGVISVQSVKEVRRFNEDDVHLLATIAANVGAAIRNAQLYQETQQRADEMAALSEIGREISATLDLEDVLERIATRARDLLSARTATIRLAEEDGSLPTVVAVGKHADKHRGTTIQMGEGITGNVAKSGVAEIINDPRHDTRIMHIPGTPQEEDELEAILFAPLMIGERVIGVMGLWRDKPVAGPFTKNDLNFLQSLARQAANAIENARLFEEVQRQKQYSEALLQNSPVAIMTTDLNDVVVSWNPAAENLFGYPANEAIGVDIRELISNESIEEEISDIYEQLTSGGRVNTVTQRYRKDGSPVDVELLSLPVVMDGKRVGLIAIYHDITELLRARREAEAANDAKSAFLATMSHEIRTPMNGVIGMTSLLLDTDLDAEQRDFTETIRSSGEALLTVINDILDFSKIEAGKMELEEQPFNLRECLESALDLLKFEASDKEVELAYQMEPDVPAVIVGDITRLRQVLINLLNNGLKFTEQGEVVLSVSTKAVPIKSNGPYTLHFSVRDTGIGIPPERLDRLFQAFSQVDASTSRKYGGTGLGLAISKRLSELMGGEMWVESVVGEGTTFHFTITTQAGPDIRERDDLRGEQPQLSGKRILIVDDNLTNRRILTLQTRAWGMLPRDTSDPRKALKWVRQGDPFDLAILDYHMPGMDGIQLSHAIREVADFPLVLFSSIGARETAMGENQFAAFLMKPLKPSVLLDTLMNLFAGEAKKFKPEDGAQKIGFDPELAAKMPLHILLVEDNAVNQKLALRLLEQMGYRADLAGNGLEAIQAVGRQKYDVVLMDVQMPEMDGLEASRRICARWPRGERPHIVAMTANAMQGDRERCLAAGMDDYVSKPIRVNELVAALAKAKPLKIKGAEMAKTRRN